MRGCHATQKRFFIPSLNDTPNGFFDSAVRVDEVANYKEKWSPQAMCQTDETVNHALLVHSEE